MSEHMTEDTGVESMRAVGLEAVTHLSEALESMGKVTESMEAMADLLENVLEPAADALIDVHRRTGIDLKAWPPVLAFVQTMRPEFSIVGEQPW